MRQLKFPINTIATLTSAGLAAVEANSFNVNTIALGTSTDEPSGEDADLGSKVVSYPVSASFKDGKVWLHAALEYGALLGVHEIGLYDNDVLLVTFNREINRLNNEPLILMQYRHVYLLDLIIDLSSLDNERQTVSYTANCTERNDITLAVAMWQQSVSNQIGNQDGDTQGSANGIYVPKPTKTGQVLATKVEFGEVVAYWADLSSIPAKGDLVDTANDGYNEWGIARLYNLVYDGNALSFVDESNAFGSKLTLALPFDKTIEMYARTGNTIVHHDDFDFGFLGDYSTGLIDGMYASRFGDGDFEGVEFTDDDVIKIQVKDGVMYYHNLKFNEKTKIDLKAVNPIGKVYNYFTVVFLTTDEKPMPFRLLDEDLSAEFQ